MFLDFFDFLRLNGLPVSLAEWLDLMEALRLDLHESSLTGFYRLCRAVLITKERDLDRFDELFLAFFQDPARQEKLREALKKAAEERPEQKLDQAWLRQEGAIHEEERPEDPRESFGDDTKAHRGGLFVLGEEGYSAYGQGGRVAGGVRVGDQGGGRSAFMVAAERHFRDWREDNTLDARQFQMAFRKLRQLSDHNLQEKTELDLDTTIDDTCANAGFLKLAFKPPRKNAIRVLMLIDSGGSMQPYQQLCSLLFQSVSKANNFNDLQIYYFHNCIEEVLFKDPQLSWNSSVPTEQLFRKLNRNYRVIFVGDAEMAPYELTNGGYENRDGRLIRSGLQWLQYIRRGHSHSIWLHPQKAPDSHDYWTETFYQTKAIFPMYQLTLDGLNAGIKKLLRG